MYKYVDGERIALTQPEIDAFNAGGNPDAGKTVRSDRNALLSGTDWWVLPDRTPTQAQLDYRSALRDLPQQGGFPDNVIWPEEPK